MSQEQPVSQDSPRTAEPLVSVVVPIFNAESYLKECIDSVLAQTYQALELILVNDGSSDQSAKIIEQAVQSNPSRKILALEKTNGGAADARNYGLVLASGRIVMCLDSDDALKPNYIARAISTMRESSAAIVYSDLEQFGAVGGRVILRNFDPYVIRYNLCIPNAALFDRGLWNQVGGFKTSLPCGEMWDFWLSVSRLLPRITRIDEALIRRRVKRDPAIAGEGQGMKDMLAIAMISNPDLYAVEEVLQSHSQLSVLEKRSLRRNSENISRYADQWLPKFVAGAAKQKDGDNQAALDLYMSASQVSMGRNWQALFRAGNVSEALGRVEEAIKMYHQTRIFRPDMARYINQKIQQLSQGGTGTGGSTLGQGTTGQGN